MITRKYEDLLVKEAKEKEKTERLEHNLRITTEAFKDRTAYWGIDKIKINNLNLTIDTKRLLDHKNAAPDTKINIIYSKDYIYKVTAYNEDLGFHFMATKIDTGNGFYKLQASMDVFRPYINIPTSSVGEIQQRLRKISEYLIAAVESILNIYENK